MSDQPDSPRAWVQTLGDLSTNNLAMLLIAALCAGLMWILEKNVSDAVDAMQRSATAMETLADNDTEEIVLFSQFIEQLRQLNEQP